MDVVCAGILIADLFASPVDSLPGPGELRTTERFLMGAGGCATNTAACLRKLGRTVTVVGKVGRDLFGDFVVSDLERLGIGVANVRRSADHATAVTVILNVRGEDRRYLHAIGTNADFRVEDIDLGVLDGARVLYAGGYLAMPGFRAADLRHLFENAKQRSLTTVLDVVIPAGGEVSMAQIEPALPYTDYFLPNEDEGRRLTGIEEAAGQADFLVRRNPACTVVITRGARGSLARCGELVVEAPPFRMESVDDSGAGDAFTAGFITGLLEHWPLQKTLRFASAVGASCTRALGCTAGVFRFEEAVAFLAGHSQDAVPDFCGGGR